MAYIVVISGLSGAGKTTLAQSLSGQDRVFVPSTSTMRRNRNEFPDISSSREDTLKKQQYYLELDKTASKIALNISNCGKTAICDRDFLSAIAHNYAVSKTNPNISIYPWIIQQYTQALQTGDLTIPDYHVFLDIPLEKRKEHAMHEMNRERDKCFFKPDFTHHYVSFYKGALSCLPSLWLSEIPKDFTFDSLNIKNVHQDKEQSKLFLIKYLIGTTSGRHFEFCKFNQGNDSR